MKKLVNMILVAVALMMLGCQDEKPFVTIEGELPIKTSTLYMVGDATPAGWSIDNPEPLIQNEQDKMLFEWEGNLYPGEFKLYLVPGDWGNGCIRPEQDQREVNSTDIVNEKFVMYAGDPDNKWRVTEAGKYKLSFNLRDWTMSTAYLGGQEGPSIEPIEAENVYIVGDGCPSGWEIGSPMALTKTADYTFVYEGNLYTDGEGAIKFCCSTGDWGCKWIRPLEANVTIGKSGVASEDFTYTVSPDDKWKVTEKGKYRLTLNLKDWKIAAEYLGECDPEGPVKACIYIVGDATPNGWNINSPCRVEETDTEGVFVWTGNLSLGEFKACREKGQNWQQAFIHPMESTILTATGISGQPLDEYAGDPDIKWTVQEAATYTLTFDLNSMTLSAEIKQ